jgi:hypothetical protein
MIAQDINDVLARKNSHRVLTGRRFAVSLACKYDVVTKTLTAQYRIRKMSRTISLNPAAVIDA